MGADMPNIDLAIAKPGSMVIRPRLIGVQAIVRFVAWGLCLGLFVFVVPKIEAMFKDYNLPLPRNTIFAISTAHQFIRYQWLILAGLILVIPGSEWLTLHTLAGLGNRDLFRWLSRLMLATPFVIVALTLIALSLPLVCLCPMRLTG